MMTASRRWTVKAECGADGKPYDHWPAGQAKQPVALQIGQCEETGAERNRDAVVRIAAKDTHQQHQEVAVFEIFIGNTGILRNEERDDASGRESHDGCFVSVEEFVRIRTEQQDKHGRAKDSGGTLGGAGDVTGQIDQ